MNANKYICWTLLALVACQYGHAIDYKQNTISSGGTTSVSTYSSVSFSTMNTRSGTNVATMTSRVESMPSFDVDDFAWAEHGFGKQTLEQRIRDAEQRIKNDEQKLNKLIFIRDVCRKLEDEIRISFEKKDIRDVLNQVAEIIGSKLPYEVPEGTFFVEKSDVSGMPADKFLASVAQVSGLTLKYEKSKLVFAKQTK